MKVKALNSIERSMTVDFNPLYNHIGCNKGDICPVTILNDKLYVLDAESNYICNSDEYLFRNFEVMK